MERIAVDSSAIAAIGYDEDSCTLLVEFIKSGSYHYEGVSLETYEVFLGAESKGRFFQQNVKGRFAYSKI